MGQLSFTGALSLKFFHFADCIGVYENTNEIYVIDSLNTCEVYMFIGTLHTKKVF